MTDAPDLPRAYTPGEVATLFKVDPRSVRRWAVQGKLSFFSTPGGARRYHADEIDRMIANGEHPHG